MITFENVSFAYNGNRVLENASFGIKKGESICMIGPNGGGKTTIFRLLLGLLKPDSGNIEILGTSPRRARTRIGYMPQHFDFDPKFPVTALDIVLMGNLNRIHGGRYSSEDKAKAHEALERVGLSNEALSGFTRLSGGQRQRVLIARALACDPEILLLDEPTANVDLTVEARFLETIEELRSQVTILTITHDLGVASHFGDHVLCVNRSVHSHSISDLSGEVILEIFSDEKRHEHERHALHDHGDHSKCDHH